VLLSMSRRVSPLAGFQVTIIGRFWVTTEVDRAPMLVKVTVGAT
jgi:hypothetical protein